jgi:hypothetical protein
MDTDETQIQNGKFLQEETEETEKTKLLHELHKLARIFCHGWETGRRDAGSPKAVLLRPFSGNNLVRFLLEFWR